MTDLQETLVSLGKRAKTAARQLASLSSAQKNAGLQAIAEALIEAEKEILTANAADTEAGKQKGLSSAMLDRLTLNSKRISAMAEGVRQVATLPDPVGETIREWTRPNGLHIRKIRVPIGVIGIIYESRPNVTSDAAVLCTKTGNATILRGGSESIRSNIAIATALSAGAAAAGLPADAIQLVPTTERAAVEGLCKLDRYLDVLIPRGGRGLIETVVSHARMPVIKHYDGICILYVDAEADLEMTCPIILNAKCQRPGVCNAVETVLVHRAVLARFLESTGKALAEAGVQLRCDPEILAAATRIPDLLKSCIPATSEDFTTEFLDLILALKVVDSPEEAMRHIADHGSHHSDGILTTNSATAELFLNEVDSATVYWNASTRFTDGGEFGFGAEIGISTDKLHARGPVGLEELTTYKYQLRGTGQIRT
jgi:glutamate-5-semialdehyde dehydrogenase